MVASYQVVSKEISWNINGIWHLKFLTGYLGIPDKVRVDEIFVEILTITEAKSNWPVIWKLFRKSQKYLAYFSRYSRKNPNAWEKTELKIFLASFFSDLNGFLLKSWTNSWRISVRWIQGPFSGLLSWLVVDLWQRP